MNLMERNNNSENEIGELTDLTGAAELNRQLLEKP